MNAASSCQKRFRLHGAGDLCEELHELLRADGAAEAVGALHSVAVHEKIRNPPNPPLRVAILSTAIDQARYSISESLL